MTFFYIGMCIYLSIGLYCAWVYSKYNYPHDRVLSFILLFFIGVTVWPIIVLAEHHSYLHNKRKSNTKEVEINRWGIDELVQLEIFKEADFYGYYRYIHKDSYIDFKIDYTYPYNRFK